MSRFLRVLSSKISFRVIPVVSRASSFTPQRFFGEAAGGHFLPREEIEPRVLECIKNFRDVDAGKVTPEATFSKDLGLDSLDTVELVLSFEDEFNIEIPETDAGEIGSANDAIKYISQTPFAK
mmetsp:Transcript_3625/g.4935  ORF Transcript_3625/g.4935 Transcript_3625/m.4935 type:complete len:123 (-) Transcript_3625:284-652(-)|eukprot:CAMPEP_0185262574 /NCGR_PEP_ID=MMETSP1359-20130426/10684_1 /TAXON_ID=552665 /ORGANISM="Bigelowiella longifila, Strain CCMP242" /LENGTH=122 /DNA_ID=CAMNT_0027849557 /DNA_START=64 /DNA_END=432 /DNA_ORIENTATION=+